MAAERDYIELCKCEIEKRFALENINSSLKSRDFEYLAEKIKEKSGISLSLSTLKRLWRKNSSLLPQSATLNALVSILDYKDWQDFKQKNPIVSKKRTIKKNYKKTLLFAFSIFVILALVALFVHIKYKVKEPIINGEIHFSADKTKSLGVPNTVVFKYDVSNVIADSFFIQQSWNDRNKERIDPHKGVLSSIYHFPGFHRAKLIANNTVIATQNIHILSDGWMPYINYDVRDPLPIVFNMDSSVSEGHFNLKKSDLLKASIDINKNFILRLNNSRDFGVTDNNFSVKTIFKCDSIKPIACPRLELMLVFDVQIFWISLVKKGCEYYADYKIGEIYAGGKENDLTSLGCNVYDWQELGLSVHNKNAEILLNGNSVFHFKYVKNFGELVGIIYTFDGLGSVDFISVSDGNGKIVYRDDFN